MKPWFEKAVVEGDIIKFPEPEKTVIQMPNVASYPDFLTGVKDLHNRKEKGEISIKEKQKNKKALLTDKAKQTNLYKAVLEKFPDANLVDVVSGEEKD